MKKIEEYVVRWEIPVMATDVVDAAKKAQVVMLDPENLATYFEVMPPRGEMLVAVDLSEGEVEEEE